MFTILRTTVILSAILGAGAGVLFLINFLLIKFLIVFILFIFAGGGMIVYLKRQNIAGFLTIQDGALIGSVTGFVSLVTSSLVFLPINYLMGLFSTTYKQFINFTDITYSFIITVVMVFFVALVISAPFNAISAMLAAYIYDKIEERPVDFDSQLELEQDE